MDMEQWDGAKAQRIWQRVQERKAPSPGKAPSELIALCLAQCSRYGRLSRHLAGKYGQMLRGYACQQQKNANCMRGLCRLSGIALPPEPAEQDASGRHLLILCLQEENRLMGLLAGMSPDPNWGELYRLLAGEALERLRGLLEILGALK